MQNGVRTVHLTLAGFWLGGHPQACQLDAAVLPGLIQGLWVVWGVLHEYGHGQVCEALSLGLRSSQSALFGGTESYANRCSPGS